MLRIGKELERKGFPVLRIEPLKSGGGKRKGAATCKHASSDRMHASNAAKSKNLSPVTIISKKKKETLIKKVEQSRSALADAKRDPGERRKEKLEKRAGASETEVPEENKRKIETGGSSLGATRKVSGKEDAGEETQKEEKKKNPAPPLDQAMIDTFMESYLPYLP